MSYGKSGGARALPILISLLAVALAGPALASLGGDYGSVDADNARLKGQLLSTSMLQYDRHDISTGSGSVVHEYMTRGGKVFAVTWQGRLPPDLQQLFGNYFETFRSAAAAQSHPGGHHQLSVVQGDLVVHSIGLMRTFRGKAYVPSLVPAGVSIAELQ